MAFLNIGTKVNGSLLQANEFNATVEAIQNIQRGVGWGSYQNTINNSGNPFQHTASGLSYLPNNKGITIESELPGQVSTFYDGDRIWIDRLSLVAITIDMITVPKSNNAFIEIGLDVGISDLIYTQFYAYPKGINVPRPITYNIIGFVGDDWGINGGRIAIRSDFDFDIYNINYTIGLTYRPGQL